MKECKYCGTSYKDELTACPNCGGNLFYSGEELAEAEEYAKKERENQQRAIAEPKSRAGKVAGIVVGIVVLIAAIIAVASNAYNNHAVSSGLSRADMEEAYNRGMAYYSNKDYVAAIAELKNVSTESKYYSEASETLKNAVVAYSENALSRVTTYANNEDYEMACSVLTEVLQTIPSDLQIDEASIVSSLQDSAFNIAKNCLSAGDYPDAIPLLRSANELAANTDIDALLEKSIGEYRDMTIAQTNTALDSEGYEAAVVIVNKALSVLPNDTALLRLSETCEAYKPIPLSDFKTIGSYSFERVDMAEDIVGNEYANPYVLTGSMSSSWGGGVPYWEVFVGGEYATLSVVIAPSDGWNWREEYPDCIVGVYGDDTLLEQYTVNYKDLAFKASVDITGINYLKFTINDFNLWDQILLVDPFVSK